MSPARRRSGDDSRSRSRSKRKSRKSRSRSRDQRKSSRRERSKSRSRTRDRRKRSRSKSPEPPKLVVRKASRFSAAPVEPPPSRPPPGVAGGNNANLVPVAPRKPKTQLSDPAESKAKYESLQEKLLRLSQKSKPLGAGGAASIGAAQGMSNIGSGYAAASSVGGQGTSSIGSGFTAASNPPIGAQGIPNTGSRFSAASTPPVGSQGESNTGSRFSAVTSESFGGRSVPTGNYGGSYAGSYPSSGLPATEETEDKSGQQYADPYSGYQNQYQPTSIKNQLQAKAPNAEEYDGCPFTNNPSDEPPPPGHEPEEQEPPPPGHDDEPLPPGQSEPHPTHWTPHTTSAHPTSTNQPTETATNPYQYGDYASMAQAAASYGNMTQPPQGAPYTNYSQPPPMWPPPQAPGSYQTPSWGGQAPTMDGIPSKGLWQPPSDNQKPPMSPTSERLSKVWAGVGGRTSPSKITMNMNTADATPVSKSLEKENQSLEQNSKSSSKEDNQSRSRTPDLASKGTFQEEIMRTIQKKRETIAMSLSETKSLERSYKSPNYQQSIEEHKSVRTSSNRPLSRNRSTSKLNERRRSPSEEHPASSSRSTSRDRKPDKSRSNSKVNEKLMKLSATIEEDEKESFMDSDNDNAQTDKVPFVRAEKKVGLLAGKIKDKLNPRSKSPEKRKARRSKSRGRRGSRARSPIRRSTSLSKKNESRRKYSRSRSVKRSEKPKARSKSRRKSKSVSRLRKERSKSRSLKKRSRSRRRSQSGSKSRRRRSRSGNKRSNSGSKNRPKSKDRKLISKGRSFSREETQSKSRKKIKRSHSRSNSPHSSKRIKPNEDFKEEKLITNRDHEKNIDYENNSTKYDVFKESKTTSEDKEKYMELSTNKDDEKEIRKKKKKDKKKKKKRKKSGGSSSSDSESSDDGSKKKKKKKDKKKKSKKSKRDPKEQLEELTASIAELERKAHMAPEAVAELEERVQLAPMTKEAWEKKQTSVRREFDEDTGRMRLVRGGGEILEECVSKDRMMEINRQATKADGESFQRDLKNKLGD